MFPSHSVLTSLRFCHPVSPLLSHSILTCVTFSLPGDLTPVALPAHHTTDMRGTVCNDVLAEEWCVCVCAHGCAPTSGLGADQHR
jgi:hypothetical protein